MSLIRLFISRKRKYVIFLWGLCVYPKDIHMCVCVYIYIYMCIYIYIYLCVICLWGNVYNGVRYIMYISLGQISTWVTELLGLADACLVLLPRV